MKYKRIPEYVDIFKSDYDKFIDLLKIELRKRLE